MASLADEKMKEMEAEMNRFEQEISGPSPVLTAGMSLSMPVTTMGHSAIQPLIPVGTPMMSSDMGMGAARPAFIPHQIQIRTHPLQQPSTMASTLPMPPAPPQMLVPPGMPHMPLPPMMPGMPPLPPPAMMPTPPGMPMRAMPQPVRVQHAPAVICKPPTVYSSPPVRFTKSTEQLETITRTDSPVIFQSPAQLNTDVSTTGAMLNDPVQVAASALQTPAYQLPTSTQNIDAMKEDKIKDKPEKRKKKFVRTAAGTAWEDDSLSDWDPNDFRIFCGDLGNEVTDELLTRTFSKYPSFLKAKVIRDKRTNKTKGFGFVSFKDPNDFVAAMREMNGKYVGNRPIKLRKSSWRDRNIEIVKKKQREKERLGLR